MGAVRSWRLGGKRTDFTIGPDAAFSWQHDIRRRDDGTISVFDNEAGITDRSKQSRGLILEIDETARTATPGPGTAAPPAAARADPG